MKYLILCFALVSAIPIFAQSAAPSASQAPPAAPAWSPSKDIGMFVFGKNGQTADQQLKDESECYGAARQQTGIDPKAPAPAGKTAEQKAAEQKAAAESAQTPKGDVLKEPRAGRREVRPLARLLVMPARERLQAL